MVVGGVILIALGSLAFTQAGSASNEWLPATLPYVRGAGMSGAVVGVKAGAFQAVPRDEVAHASSTTRIVQQVGGSFGSAMLAMILANQPGPGYPGGQDYPTGNSSGAAERGSSHTRPRQTAKIITTTKTVAVMAVAPP